MAMDPSSTTPITLLGRLQRDPKDVRAWGEFVTHFRPRILSWCRRWGVQDADAEDITQMVLLKLSQKMADFSYDAAGSFRAWLKTVTRHAWYDFQKTQRQPAQGTGETVLWTLLESVEARDDLLLQIDKEWHEQLLDQAIVRVKLRVSPKTWEAFRLTALDGLPGREAGKRLGVAASMIFLHKHRVQKLIEEELKDLDKIT
jgi:RNA polymerase sigma factor (sigma-70 family)